MRKIKLCAHWDANDYQISQSSLEVYQACIDGDLQTHMGHHTVEDNFDTADGIYGRGVRRFNTDLISIAACCMRGATESTGYPNFGSQYPLKEDQFYELCKLAAVYCERYSIPVQRDRVFTHAEVEGTFGIKQNGKWDISVLPWDPSRKGHRAVGDYFRSLVSMYLLKARPDLQHLAVPDELPSNRPTLRHGDHGTDVRILQTDLHDLRFHVGKIDGDFGNRTRAAVLAFQADNGLTTDGIVGPRTWAALAVAAPRPLRDVKMDDLTESGTLRDLQTSDRLADTTGLLGVVAAANQASGQVQELQTLTSDAIGLWQMAKPYWPILLIAAAYLIWRGLNAQTAKRRLQDAITGAHDGR